MESQGSERLKRLIILLLCVMGVWALYLLGMLYLSGRWDTLSNFGQSFGAVDSLFSGLAFAGLIYAILLQREDLQLTRKELNRTASAQKRQAKTMLLTSKLNAMTLIIEITRAEREMDRNAPLGFKQQLVTFAKELQRELDAINQELQQEEDAPHAP